MLYVDITNIHLYRTNFWLLTVLNIQNYIYHPQMAHKGPVLCDFNKPFIFSVCCVGVKDSSSTIPLVQSRLRKYLQQLSH